MAGIWRAKRKEIKRFESASNYEVGDRILVDGLNSGVVVSLWGSHHYKVATDDGLKHLIKEARLSKQ